MLGLATRWLRVRLQAMAGDFLYSLLYPRGLPARRVLNYRHSIRVTSSNPPIAAVNRELPRSLSFDQHLGAVDRVSLRSEDTILFAAFTRNHPMPILREYVHSLVRHSSALIVIGRASL